MLHEVAEVCINPLCKPFSLLRLAPCCRVLRSRWCQSGVRSWPESLVLFTRLPLSLSSVNRACWKLTARESRLLLEVGLYLFEATFLGLSYQGTDEDKGDDPDHRIPQESDAWSPRR